MYNLPANLMCPDCHSSALLKKISGNRDSPEDVYEIWCPVCGISGGPGFNEVEAFRKWRNKYGHGREEHLVSFCYRRENA